MSELKKFEGAWEPIRAADLNDQIGRVDAWEPARDNSLAIGCSVVAVIVLALTVLALVVTL